MAIINVNGISGINSITAQSGSLNFYTAAGNNLPISAATLNVGTGASISSPGTNVLVLGTNNAERVRVGAAGSVGIGTDNPLGVLAVSGGVSNPTITFQNGSASNTAPDALVGGIVGYSRTTGGNINIGSVDIRTDTASASSGAVRILTALNGSLAETFRITSTGQLQATGAADVRLTLGSGGTAGTNDSVHIRADGANLKFMNASGGVTIFEQNGTERVRISTSGHLVPGADNTYDLGASGTRWRNVYTADLQMSNEGSSNDIDGTWGSYTIQEGENDLFLINRRTGKRYKFLLEEVK